MKILIIIAAALTALLGVKLALTVEVLAVAAGCFLIVRKVRLTGWIIPRGAMP